METFFARLERRFGRYAINQLPLVIAGGMAAVFVLTQLRPSFVNALTLDLNEVRRGQVWRLFTYLFLPTSRSPLWILFSLYWTWLVGNHLEQAWGTFKFNCFYLLGMIGTTVAAWLTSGAEGNTWLHLSLFFAFATLFPNYEVFFFFVIPVSIKWIALLLSVFLLASFAREDWITRGAILAAVSNYILFFGNHWWRYMHASTQHAQSLNKAILSPVDPPLGKRSCFLCQAREEDGSDIRVCSCPKCGGPRTLCLEHARNH